MASTRRERELAREIRRLSEALDGRSDELESARHRMMLLQRQNGALVRTLSEATDIIRAANEPAAQMVDALLEMRLGQAAEK